MGHGAFQGGASVLGLVGRSSQGDSGNQGSGLFSILLPDSLDLQPVRPAGLSPISLVPFSDASSASLPPQALWANSGPLPTPLPPLGMRPHPSGHHPEVGGLRRCKRGNVLRAGSHTILPFFWLLPQNSLLVSRLLLIPVVIYRISFFFPF